MRNRKNCGLSDGYRGQAFLVVGHPEKGKRAPMVNMTRKRSIMQKRKERTARPAVQAEEQKHWSFFEHAAEGFFRSTPTGLFIEMNPALVRLLGYESVEEVLALTLPEDLYLHAAQYADLGVHFAAAERIKGKELHWKKKDGSALKQPLSGRPSASR